MGLFDSLIGGVTSFFSNPDTGSVADTLGSIGSELGGSLLDQLTGAGGAPTPAPTPGAITDLFGGIFGPGAMPTNPLLPAGLTTLFTNTGPNALDTSTPIVDPGGGFPAGGGMSDSLSLGDLGTFGPFVAKRNKGVPWKRIARMVKAALAQFGPQVALLLVNALAQRLQGMGVQDANGNAITGGEILFRAIASSSRPRRARGITGRQLSITGRTIRKLNSMHAKIAAIAGRGRRSSSAPRYAFQRRRRRAA